MRGLANWHLPEAGANSAHTFRDVTFNQWLFYNDFNNISNNSRHGLALDFYCKYNVIRSNIITGNNASGVILEYYSRNNLIQKNNFMNNSHHGFLLRALINKWNNNYWDDWLGLKYKSLSWCPKIISGRPRERFPYLFCFNSDLHPAKKPYVIIV